MSSTTRSMPVAFFELSLFAHEWMGNLAVMRTQCWESEEGKGERGREEHCAGKNLGRWEFDGEIASVPPCLVSEQHVIDLRDAGSRPTGATSRVLVFSKAKESACNGMK